MDKIVFKNWYLYLRFSLKKRDLSAKSIFVSIKKCLYFFIKNFIFLIKPFIFGKISFIFKIGPFKKVLYFSKFKLTACIAIFVQCYMPVI